MLDLMPSLKEWQPAVSGRRCAVATVVGAGGSVPRPLGTSMLVSESGEVLGSLSGGCVEGAVVEAALEAMHDGGMRREFFGYSTEDAFAVGLTCGGELEVHIEPLGTAPGGLRLENLRTLAGNGAASALALIRRVDAHGGGAVVIPDPATFLPGQSAELAVLLGLHGANGPEARRLLRAAAAQLEPLLRGGRTGLVRLAPPEGCLSDAESGAGAGARPGTDAGLPGNAAISPEPITLLVESRLPPARLLIFGANDFGAALLPAAQLLGYHVTLCDARPAFAGQARFAGADQVVTAWPHRYLAEEAAAGRIDTRTVACVLTHDPKFDIPLLQAALGLDLAYVGAMGSRRSHRQRVDSLLAAGVSAEDLIRLHSPIGLDLGAVTPAEVAVSITAELVAARNRRAGSSVQAASLKDGAGPIHGTGPLHGTFSNATTPQHQETPWT
ncbi:XdhC family protein [Arthrobacter sp. B10-11]|uniref:XdhC family protein n=1 Tax=Arthrobacter sp. B10-11 TaxID=3081160 RepID=UPI0029538BD1|nr:XdhC family protein [Arthrobacter sp. B10-11]MDV8150006.1 XdhC family protein [Arthrobacter sp. B10-11]